MIDKNHLRDKQVIFRLNAPHGEKWLFSGTVKFVESDGFWIESPPLIGQLKEDSAWKAAVDGIQGAVLFIPTSSLMYLIAAKE